VANKWSITGVTCNVHQTKLDLEMSEWLLLICNSHVYIDKALIIHTMNTLQSGYVVLIRC